MRKRKHLSRRRSKRLFKATANKVHKRNLARPARGGIRL